MRRCRILLGLILCSIISISYGNISDQNFNFRLANGLQVFVQQDHRAPVVNVEILYKVGSTYEPNGITGISHALEHMMFRGTPQYPDGEFNQLITDNGGQFNATTGTDYTNYFELINSDKLELVLKLEANRMRHLILSPKAFEKEHKAIIEERRMRVEDNPDMVTYERFAAASYISNPLHHLPIGWMSDVQHLTVKNLRDWYDKWYRPNNAVLVIVGDVNKKQVIKLVDKYFGPIKRHNVPKLKPHPNQRSLGTVTVHVQQPAELPVLYMGYKTPRATKETIATSKNPKATVAEKDIAMEPYALSVLSGILGGSDSSRLPKDLIRNQRIANGIDSDYDPYTLYPEQFMFSAIPSKGKSVAEVKAAIEKQIKDLQTNLVSKQELHHIIVQTIAQKTYALDSIQARTDLIGSLEVIGLPWTEQDNYITQLEKVTPQQVQAVAKKYLIPKNLTVAILDPQPLNGKTPVSGIGALKNVH